MRATVQPPAEPGYAILRITELDASPDGLTISIQRQQGPDSHLADDGWRRTEAWLQPEQVARLKGALEFQLGPEICDRLAGIATIRLRVKEPDIGVVGTTVVAWPQMLTSGAVDLSSRDHDDTVRLRAPRARTAARLPPPAPPFEPAPEPEPAPMPELRAEREPFPSETGGGRARWLIAAVIVLLLAGGGYFAYTNYIQPHEEPRPRPSRRPCRRRRPPAAAVSDAGRAEEIRARDGRRVSRDQSRRPRRCWPRRKEFAKAGEMNAAFLVWRRAAETGNAPAQVELASFYDPLVDAAQGRLHARRRARRRLVRARGAGRQRRGAAQVRPAARQGRRRTAGRSGPRQDRGCSRRRRRTTPRPRRRWRRCPSERSIAGLLLAIVALPAYGQTLHAAVTSRPRASGSAPGPNGPSPRQGEVERDRRR